MRTGKLVEGLPETFALTMVIFFRYSQLQEYQAGLAGAGGEGVVGGDGREGGTMGVGVEVLVLGGRNTP